MKIFRLLQFLILLALFTTSCHESGDQDNNPLGLTTVDFGIIEEDSTQADDGSVAIEIGAYGGFEYENRPKVDYEIHSVEQLPELSISSSQFARLIFDPSVFRSIRSKRILGNPEVHISSYNQNSLEVELVLHAPSRTYLDKSFLLVEVERIHGGVSEMLFKISRPDNQHADQSYRVLVDSVSPGRFTDLVMSRKDVLYLFYEDTNQLVRFFNDSLEAHPFFEVNDYDHYIRITALKNAFETSNRGSYHRDIEPEYFNEQMEVPVWLGMCNKATHAITSKRMTLFTQGEATPEYSAIAFTSGKTVALKTVPGVPAELQKHLDRYRVAEEALAKMHYERARLLSRRSVEALSYMIKQGNSDESLIREAKLLLSEFQSLQFNAINGLDLYGNPPGWVPMISYEINKAAYENEVDYAVNAIYIHSVLQDANQTLSERIAKLSNSLKKLENENRELEQKDRVLLAGINSDSLLLFEMRHILEGSKDRMGEITDRMLGQAKSNVSRRSFFSMVSFVSQTVAQVALVVPGGAVVSAVAAGVSVLASIAGNFDVNDPLSMDNLSLIAEQSAEFAQSLEGVSASLEDSQEAPVPNNPTVNNLKSQKRKKQKDLAGKTAKYATVVQSSLGATVGVVQSYQGLIPGATRDKEVQDELKVLLSKDGEYKQKLDDFKMAVDSSLVLSGAINEKLTTYRTNEEKILRNLETTIILEKNKAQTQAKLSPAELVTIANMKNRSMKRLFEYHYLMAKAYEYRLIQPFPEDHIDMEGFIQKIQATIKEANGSLNAEVFNKSRIFFTEILQAINHKILNYYNSGGSLSRTECVYYALSQDEIDVLNRGEALSLNLNNIQNLFPPNEENLRMINLSVASCTFNDDREIQAHQQRDVQSTAEGSEYVRINVVHEGISTIQKNGRLYRFNHRNSDKHDPISWETHIDLVGNTISEGRVSKDSRSLILNAAGKDTQGDMMLFSTPGINADLFINAWFNTSLRMKSVVLKLEYNKEQLDKDLSLLRVYSNIDSHDLYFDLSQADINGFQNSTSTQFQRCYPAHSEIILQTIPRINGYTFKSWDIYRQGEWKSVDSLHHDHRLSLTLNDHTIIRAVFD